MCRRPCCDNSGGQGAGFVAVAVIIGAALIAAKIGPVVARIIHVVVEVLRLVALTTGLVVALAAVTWAAITITRWQLRRKALMGRQTRMVPYVTTRVCQTGARPGDCLACGGRGHVLRVSRSGGFTLRACPECQPARLAG